MKQLLLVWILCGLFQFSFAQQTEINGLVKNADGNPLVNVHVFTKKNHATTNEHGRFVLSANTPEKGVKVQFSHIGYMPKDTLLLPGKHQITIILSWKNQDLGGVTIQGRGNKKTVAYQNTIDTKTLENQKNQSLGEVLQSLPGVSVLKTGQGIQKPIIHGMYGSRVGIYVQGIALEDQQWGSEHSPSIDLNNTQKIAVIKGAAALQYGGNAIGGMVLLEAMHQAKDTAFGQAIWFAESNGLGGGFSSNYHWNKSKGWSWRGTLGFKKFGDRSAPGYVLSNTGNQSGHAGIQGSKVSEKKSHWFQYHYFYNELGILRASHLGNVTDLYTALQSSRPLVMEDFTYQIQRPKQVIHHQTLLFQQKNFDENQGYHQWIASTQWNSRNEFDVNRNPNETRPALSLHLITQNLQWNRKQSVGANNQLLYGVQTLFQYNQANSPIGARTIIPTYFKTEVGSYVVGSFVLPSFWTIDAGLRYDFQYIQAKKNYLKSRWEERNYNQNFNHFIIGETGVQWVTQPKFTYHNFAANIGVQKEFPHDYTFKAQVQLAQRSPNVAELFSDGLHHSNAQIELGDLNNQPEKSVKGQLYLQKQGINATWEVAPYVQSVQNYLFLKPIGFESTIRGAFPVWEYTQTQAFLVGVDQQFKHQFRGNWSIHQKFAWIYGQDVTNHQPLIDLPPWNFSLQVQKNFTLVDAQLTYELVGRQNRFPNFNFVTNIINANNELEPVDIDISTPPASYGLLHGQISKHFTLKSGNTIEILATVRNITNQRYRDYLNRQRFFADEMGRNLQIQIQYQF
jgi:iron complex outermembrane receptor protein